MPTVTSNAAESNRRPIFVVGAPRSGTSMLHWALVQHANLWGSAESDFLSPLIEGVDAAYAKGTEFGEYHWLNKEEVTKSEFFRQIGKAIDSLYLSRSGNLRWVDQTPHYILYYDRLRTMLPGAKFIHIVRDGRQVICSMQEKFGWSFLQSTRMWKQLVEAGEAISRQARDDFLQVSYESVVQNPEQSFRQIYRFIEEEYDPNSVGFLEKPINTSPGRESEDSADKLIPRWRDWKPQKRIIFQAYCGKLNRSLGYQ
ncbi:sulfotransferase [Pseudomonadota bacterium]